MMKKLKILALLLLFSTGLLAQNIMELYQKSNNYGRPIRLTPQEIEKISERAIQKTLQEDPDFFNQKLSGFKKNYVIGEQRNFYALNMETGTYYILTATLKAEGNLCRIWVENASLDSNYVTDQIIQEILNNLEVKTPSTSIDSTLGIIEIDTTYFGQPPNIDGDGIVDFLILDIKDGWQPGQGFIAGYFSPNDQNPNNQGSNGMDLMYIDSKPGIYYNGYYSTRTVMGTTAHEFQHLIHYHYDPYEMTFFNEAMSQLAATYCGYGVDDPMRYLANPNSNLIAWNGTLYDYSRANLFSLYLAEQFGVQFIKSFVQSTLQGPTAINSLLNSYGYNETFNDVYRDWALCNIINDTLVNSKWGYRHPDLYGITASVEDILSFPTTTTDTVDTYGALYYRVMTGKNLTITPQANSSFFTFIKYTDPMSVVDLPLNSSYSDSTFGVDYSKAIVFVGNTQNAEKVNITFEGEQNLAIKELKYDDGTPDEFGGGYTYLTLGDSAAGYGWLVKFTLPPNTFNVLQQYKVLVGSISSPAQGAAQIRLFASNNGTPGDELMNPYDVTFVQGWNEVDLSSLGISLPDTFFIGFSQKTDQSSIAVGMDNSLGQNVTWLLRPNGNHELLADLSSQYSGYNMMMRVVVGIQNNVPAYFHSGIMQNPFLTRNADILIVGESPLEKSNLNAWLIHNTDTTSLTLKSIDVAGQVFAANGIELSASGEYKIKISGNYVGSTMQSDTTMAFTVNLMKAWTPGHISSPNGEMVLDIPANSLNKDGVFIVKAGMNCTSVDDISVEKGIRKRTIKLYSIQFNKNILQAPATLKFISNSAQLSIAKVEDGEYILLPTVYKDGFLSADITEPGVYALVSNDQVQNGSLISQFHLYQNYPNPFNPSTIIKVDIPQKGEMQLNVFNILGQKIKTLYNSSVQPGTYQFTWDGKDEKGSLVANGIYIYQVQYNGKVYSRKMVFMK